MESLNPLEGLKLVGMWTPVSVHQSKLYMAAMGLDSEPDTRKIVLLLTVAGPHTAEVFNTFKFEEVGDRNKWLKS